VSYLGEDERRELCDLAAGHPEDVRTFVAHVVLLADLIVQLRALTDGNHKFDLRELTRAWDGLNGREDVDIIFAAMDVLRLRLDVALAYRQAE
jgi:hypothetical protein